MLGQAGFRINEPYGLVFTNPGDTTHANIELPTSSATLQVGVGDLANDDFTGRRGKWAIVSQALWRESDHRHHDLEIFISAFAAMLVE